MTVPAGISGGETGGEGTPAPSPEVTPSNTTPDSTGAPSPAPAQTDGINPAWTPVLDKLPESLRPLITPDLRQWDKNFQEQLQKVQSEYEPYQAYKPFVENQVNAEELAAAHQIFQALNADPQAFYQNLAEYLQLGDSGQGQGQQDNGAGVEELDFNDPGVDITQHPKFQELMQNQQALAQAFMQQEEAKQMAALEQQIDQELAQIKQTHPNIDEVMLLQTATANNVDLAKAAEMLIAYNERILTASRTPAPTVANPAGGGLPAVQPVDPKTLDKKGTQQLVAQMLAAHNGG